MNKTARLALPLMFCSGLLLGGCQKENPETGDLSQQQQEDAEVMKQLETPPVKLFPATPNDAHDIQLLEDYESRFLAMSDELEEELGKMRQEGSLTEEFEQQRKREHIQSARNMLRELDLKTEQGRYIQGLHAEYWDNQATLLEQQPEQKGNNNQVQGLGDYLHGQEQLKHWKNQQQTASKQSQPPFSEPAKQQ
ncbi:MAG TPA: hypothetical protein DCM33_06755 [Acinetobacter radioresistens]|nr:hypothetical protein [Acinetobacter radioresistens]